jgi:beta-glucuronidase
VTGHIDRAALAVALAAAAALVGGCGSERAALTPVRPVSVPLSGPWRFAVDPARGGVRSGWFRPDFRDAGWTTIVVPHTWNVMPPYRNYSGLAWYRRSFALSTKQVRDAHLRLRFGAVFYAARVWRNGRELGRHEGGYTPFELDATAAA